MTKKEQTKILSKYAKAYLMLLKFQGYGENKKRDKRIGE
tara:strand:+ start:510 stop:626 length:117 start_codon:yes stop_codon:yes gene_type:complete